MDVRWITAFVDRGQERFETSVEFWSTITGSSLSARRGGADEFATLVPLDGSDAHLRVQQTGSGWSGSHIDLHVSDVRAAADECVGWGSSVEKDNGGYVVLASPGGMAFCLVAHHGEHRRQRPVASRSTDASTLVDQVSIDCDPELFDDEVRFWTAITSWARLQARAPQFVPLDRPISMPLRIILQRRSHAAGPTSCHLDLACDDAAAATDEHVESGASVIERHTHWTVMADPAGAPYCLTARRPDADRPTPQPGLVTVDDLKAAKGALIESMPGWTPPAAYAVGVATPEGAVQWAHANHRGIHGFPAVALSKVLGHRAGSASYLMDLRTFDAAIEVLRPAGECTFYEHPNLWAWEELRAVLDTNNDPPTGTQFVAVFIGDESDPAIDDFNRQLRAELGIAER